MEEKIKEIIAAFIRVPVEEIGPGTAIGRSALGKSILLHRMYAKLGEAGLLVHHYNGINVFADLWPREQLDFGTAAVPGSAAGADASGIGIDIEEVSAMPEALDFRETEFYRMNFAPPEIAYCILQPDPYSSFAGLFAAKEAVVKADARYKVRTFDTIVIDHSIEGKPLFPGFGLSISHAGGMAVAVAIREWTAGQSPIAAAEAGAPAHAPGASGPSGQAGSIPWIAWLALLLSVLALVRVLMR